MTFSPPKKPSRGLFVAGSCRARNKFSGWCLCQGHSHPAPTCANPSRGQIIPTAGFNVCSFIERSKHLQNKPRCASVGPPSPPQLEFRNFSSEAHNKAVSEMV